MTQSRAARHLLAGFTLIELMVVMVIIGLLYATTLLSLGGSGKDSQLEQERDRLAGLIDYVRERAALQTVEYGIRCEQGGYRFLMYDNRQALWLEDPLDDALRARKLPDGLEIALIVEDRAIVLPRSPAAVPPSSAGTQAAAATKGFGSTSPTLTVPNLTPQVMLYSSGDLTSFKLTLSRTGTGRSAVLTGTSAGKFQVGAVLEKPT
jgi:general secretion pathway protein H